MQFLWGVAAVPVEKQMKGTTYSGIVYWPEHPDADLHGLIRLIIRESRRLMVEVKLEAMGLFSNPRMWDGKIWQQTQSHVEELASERHFGVFLSCPLAEQYIRPENYTEVRKRRVEMKPTLRPRTGVPKESAW